MFFKKSDPSPFGVPLEAIAQALKPTTLNASRAGNTLVVKHEALTTVVSVEPPVTAKAENATIKAIVTVKTQLGTEWTKAMHLPRAASGFNKMATLAALTEDDGRHYIGSRLTVYEGEDAWNLFFGLLVFSVVGGVDTMLHAVRRTIAREAPRPPEPSAWTEKDFREAEALLSRSFFCNASDSQLTAEFGLRAGEEAALAGHARTALWRMDARQPHPEVGGGLFCLLEMPQIIPDPARLSRVVASLNRHEMQGEDLPPHFGAWCVGGTGSNPAYVSFLPNVLHGTHGIAENMSIWAFNRAHLADALLQIEGID